MDNKINENTGMDTDEEFEKWFEEETQKLLEEAIKDGWYDGWVSRKKKKARTSHNIKA